MEQEKLKSLLQALADGSISHSDYEQLMQYLHREGTDESLLEAMNIPPAQADAPADMQRADALFSKIIHHPDISQEQNKQPAIAAPAQTRRLYRYIAAAAVLLAVAVTALLFMHRSHTETTAPAWVQVRTAAGERRQVGLPDGSQVWLNAASSIRYLACFGSCRREIFLEGEAFFTVQQNNQQPFVVHARQLHTKVLGTSFDVQAYDSTRLTITVVQGKVSVGNTATLAVLTANKQLQFNQATAAMQLADVDGTAFTAWQNGELVLNNTTLKEATDIIARWFGVQFRVSGAVANNTERASVSFKQGEQLEGIMNVVTMVYHCRYSVDKNTITINP